MVKMPINCINLSVISLRGSVIVKFSLPRINSKGSRSSAQLKATYNIIRFGPNRPVADMEGIGEFDF